MKGKRANSGQTIIESVFMVIFLLILFFLIAEFARAWYLKNSLNNAVRVAVRAAVVRQDLGSYITGSSGESCTSSSNPIVLKVCDSAGMPDPADYATTVGVFLTEDEPPSGLSSGDIITVEARTDFRGIALGFLLPDYASSSASMRYE